MPGFCRECSGYNTLRGKKLASLTAGFRLPAPAAFAGFYEGAKPMTSTITRRAALAGLPACAAALTTVSIPALAAGNDAEIIALKARRDEFLAEWRASETADDDESGRRGEILTSMERSILRIPAQSVGGIMAKVEMLLDFINQDRWTTDVADAATLYSGVFDDGDELMLTEHAAESLWADLLRLSSASGAAS